MALRREEQGEELSGDLALVIAEQCLGSLVEREDATASVDCDNTIGGGVEHRRQLGDASVVRLPLQPELLDAGCGLFFLRRELGRELLLLGLLGRQHFEVAARHAVAEGHQRRRLALPVHT